MAARMLHQQQIPGAQRGSQQGKIRLRRPAAVHDMFAPVHEQHVHGIHFIAEGLLPCPGGKAVAVEAVQVIQPLLIVSRAAGPGHIHEVFRFLGEHVAFKPAAPQIGHTERHAGPDVHAGDPVIPFNERVPFLQQGERMVQNGDGCQLLLRVRGRNQGQYHAQEQGRCTPHGLAHGDNLRFMMMDSDSFYILQRRFSFRNRAEHSGQKEKRPR